MLAHRALVVIGSMLSMAVASALPAETHDDCGKKNFLFTGLPPTHPLVAKTGYNPAEVGPKIQADIMNIVKDGYNIKGVLFGPEIPLDKLTEELEGTHWDGVGVGYGVRGPPVQELTVRFEDIIDLYKKKVPQARILFNYSPDSAEWAIKRRFPLSSNCTNSPGKILGVKMICEICNKGMTK